MYKMNNYASDYASEKVRICRSTWDAIVAYMDDEKRELVHFIYAPCAEETFLKEYIRVDQAFCDLLWLEFGIDSDDILGDNFEVLDQSESKKVNAKSGRRKRNERSLLGRLWCFITGKRQRI